MGAVAGQGTTFGLPNFLGELFKVTPTETPFLSMIGGISGGKSTTSKQFTWQTVDNNAASDSQAALEGADPVFENRTRSEVFNVVQIFQYGFELSYTKQAATGNLSGQAIIGNQPVQDEKSFQLQLKLERAARDVDSSFISGTYAFPADNDTARKTRGILAATTTNAVAAGAADLSKAMIDELMRDMVDSGAPMRSVVAFANSFNRQAFSNIYAYAPEDRTYGGVSIKSVLTDFTEFGIAYERQMPAATVGFIDVSLCSPVALKIPNKGHFFAEPLAKSGASDKYQLYGEIGLEYGPELWHGKITGTTTA